MPGKHWIVAYNSALDEYRFMRLWEDWLPFKYCAMEDIEPDWIELGVYESEDEAQRAFARFLTR